VLSLLGSAERAMLLIARLEAEHWSVPRVVQATQAETARPGARGGAAQPTQ